MHVRALGIKFARATCVNWPTKGDRVGLVFEVAVVSGGT